MELQSKSLLKLLSAPHGRMRLRTQQGSHLHARRQKTTQLANRMRPGCRVEGSGCVTDPQLPTQTHNPSRHEEGH